MWRNIIGLSIYQVVVLLVLNFCGKQPLNLTGPDATSVLNTVIFNTFLFCQIFNEVNCRDMEKMNVFKGMFDSWLFMMVMVSTVVFQGLKVEVLGTFPKTVPLSWELWLLSVLISAASLLVAAVAKCIPVKNFAAKNHQHDGYEALPTGPERV